MFYVPESHTHTELERFASLLGPEYEVDSQKIDTKPYITFCKASCMQGVKDYYKRYHTTLHRKDSIFGKLSCIYIYLAPITSFTELYLN
jgi:hypothetical protein